MSESIKEPRAQDQPLATSREEYSALVLEEFKPKTGAAQTAVETAVQTLAEQSLASTELISEDAVKTIDAMIAEIDKRLTEQVNMVLHDPQFQELEGTWRGLHYLVSNTESDEMLKIKVLNTSKKDLSKTLKKFKGTAWDQSPIFKRLYEEEYGQFGSGLPMMSAADGAYDNSFIVADPTEAWVVETCGRSWVARRFTDGTTSISNVPSIRTEF